MGHEELLGRGRSLGEAIRQGNLDSIILWGPPGSGKTTLARLVAGYTDREFIGFSAVTDGVARIREIADQARQRRHLGRGTILFCDEIHRFSRSQQDAFLPHVENGVITLIGATTENPSFALGGALLSRCRVYVLRPLEESQIIRILERALADSDRGLGGTGIEVAPGVLEFIAAQASGDARKALSVLEAAAAQVTSGGVISLALAAEVLAARTGPGRGISIFSALIINRYGAATPMARCTGWPERSKGEKIPWCCSEEGWPWRPKILAWQTPRRCNWRWRPPRPIGCWAHRRAICH